MKIGFIGLGNVGGKLAKLLSKGFSKEIGKENEWWKPFVWPKKLLSRNCSKVSG